MWVFLPSMTQRTGSASRTAGSGAVSPEAQAVSTAWPGPRGSNTQEMRFAAIESAPIVFVQALARRKSTVIARMQSSDEIRTKTPLRPPRPERDARLVGRLVCRLDEETPPGLDPVRLARRAAGEGRVVEVRI
jgi:hypothetical protein